MIRIPLTKGQFALIDDGDEWMVAPFSWHARFCRNSWYAQTAIRRESGKRVTVSMQHVILGLDLLIDHRDGNGLNNGRSNLRVVTVAQNQHNQRARRGGTSRFKGVRLDSGTGRWRAEIAAGPKRKNGRNSSTIHLGLFDTESAAAEAYDAAARKHFGEFAAVNFPKPGERAA